jgi:iron complex outermembrane receptor protein
VDALSDQSSMNLARGSASASIRAAWLVASASTCVAGRARADDAPGAASSSTVPVVEEVQVRGEPIQEPVAPRDAAVAGSVVTRDRLVGPGLEAQDVLRAQPGVVVTETGGFGAPATAAIRGATAEDTPVYLAGVRLNDDVGGTADLSLVPLWLIDRIEVYRGNAPLDADRLGPGGAIFFEPRRPTRDMGGDGYYGGSWGASKGWAYAGTRAGPVGVLAGVSGDRATNRYPFVNDHGTLFEPNRDIEATRQNADETTLEGWSLARVDLGSGATLDVVANAITREQGVPSLALLPTREARERADRGLAGLALHLPLDHQGRATLEARTSFLIGSTAYSDPLLELALYAREVRVVGRRVEQTVGAAVDVTDALRIRPVATVAAEGIERSPNDIPIGRAHREFARAAVGAEQRVGESLTLHALGSVECHRTGANPDELCDVLAPTGRVGAETGTRRVRILWNLGRYVRVPTLGQIYGVSGTIHGNPALAPETGVTQDFGIRAQTRRGDALDGAYVDAFVFARWADGLIAYERTGQGFITPYNVGAARVVGAEVLTGLALTRIVRVELAATALDPRDTSAGRTTVNDILPFRSRLIAAPCVRADWKRRSRNGLSGVGGEVRGLYQSSRYVDPAGLGVIGQQATVDLEGHVSLFDGVLTFRGRVADLFDATRTDIVGYPLPGRSVYAGLEAAW